MRRNLALSLLLLALGACRHQPENTVLPDDAAFGQVPNAGGFRVVEFPADDPGPPFYARVGTMLNQTFNDGVYVAIPLLRDPACIPADFNLLDVFDPPGPAGPGAFGCPLLVHGHFLIEPDAPLGTFPAHVNTGGHPQIWFASWPAFQAATADGVLTITELASLDPLRGTADTFNELLKPRFENHHVVISSSGRLVDGRRFTFNVNHHGDTTRSIQIRIR